MDEPTQARQDRARQVVRDYLTVAARSAGGLAEEAALNRSILSRWLAGRADLSAGSALKLYVTIERGLTPEDRQVFVNECGLPPALWGTLESSAGQRTATLGGALGAVTHGHHLMVLAQQTCAQSWEEAIPIFRAAESAFGPASSAAAMAACYVGEVYTNLGDHARAQQEFDRLQRAYQGVMDPHTEASVYEALGMLAYYMGNFPQAEAWFQRCLTLTEHWQLEYINLNVLHFLGRAYTAWGLAMALRNHHQAQDLFRRAAVHLEATRLAHIRLGNDAGLAYDLLRLAQLARIEHRCKEAGKLLKRAHQAFGGDEFGACHVELEQAQLDQEDGEIRISSFRAEGVLKAFSGIKYAKGIADALRVLGTSEQMRGHAEEALVWYVAALCALSSSDLPPNRALWGEVAALRDQLAIEQGHQGYRRLVRRIRDMIEGRQGELACLSHVAPDRSADIARVLRLLEPGLAEP